MKTYKICSDGKTVVRMTTMLGDGRRILSAWESSNVMGPHGAITTFEGLPGWYGQVTSRRLPPEIDCIPVGPERFAACDSFRDANRKDSLDAIRSVCPAAVEGGPGYTLCGEMLLPDGAEF